MKILSTTVTDELAWVFRLGKSLIGEVVRQGDKFLHKAPSMLLAMFGGNKKGGCESPRARVAVNVRLVLRLTLSSRPILANR